MGKVVEFVEPDYWKEESEEEEKEEKEKDSEEKEKEEKEKDSEEKEKEKDESEGKKKLKMWLSSEARAQVRALKDALAEIYHFHPFAAGGTCKLGEWIEAASFHSPDGSIDFGSLNNLNLGKLLEHSVPSMFGDLKTNQNRYDETVRKALEMKEPLITVKRRWREHKESSKNWQKLSPDLESIGRVLEKVLGKPAYFKPYKLNIYQKGGFFKPHVDTPVDPEKMIGTLVVNLYSPHKGGVLSVRREGEEVRFDFSHGEEGKKSWRWAFFFSDCIHELHPVEEGTRLTMTFLVSFEKFYPGEDFTYDSGNAVAEVKAPLEEDQKKALLAKVETCLTNLTFPVGILLSQKYTKLGLQPQNLKGIDADIYNCLRNTKKNVGIFPVVLHLERAHFMNDYCPPISKYVYRFTNEEIAFLNGGGDAPAAFADLIPFINIGPGQLVLDKSQEGAEYTGNESLEDVLNMSYLHTALIGFGALPSEPATQENLINKI
jgi:hypothetical protein